MRTSVASFSSLTHALCVGVNDPGDPNLPRLGTAEIDATALATALTNSEGCSIPPEQVQCLTGNDATRDSILAALRTAIAKASEEHAVIVYLAGHAVQRNGEFFFCPSALDWARSEETSLRGSDLDECIKPAKARGVLLILDCCQSAGFAEDAPESFRSLGAGEYRIVLAASRANQRSWEMADGSGTLFSRNLIDIVSGKLNAGTSAGMIYFSDLLREIQDQMAEQRESLARETPLQQPVFTGAYTQDPLLFVHRQLTLEQIKLATARYSPAYVRRRIRNWTIGVLAVLYIIGTIYYGLLKSSQYATTSGDKIAIYRGYPGLGAPGYPVHLWTLSYGPERLRNRPAPRTKLTWTAPIGKSVLPILDNETRPDFLAARAQHEGRPTEARALALAILGTPAGHTDEEALYATLVFCTVATQDDIPKLHSFLQSQRSEVRLAAAKRLAHLEPEYIYPIAQSDLPDGTGFPHEDFIRQVRDSCTPSLQRYLESLFSIDSNVPTTKQVLDAALRSGCKLSTPALVTGVLRPQLWGETDVAKFAALEKQDWELSESLEKQLQSPSLDDVRRQTVLGTIAALPTPPCLRALAGRLTKGPWWLQLEEAYALSRGCPDHKLTMEWVPSEQALAFNLVKNGSSVWNLRLPTTKSDYRNAFPFLISVAETDRRQDVADSLAKIVDQINDDYVRARALFALNSLGFEGRVNEDLLNGNNLEVRRATYELIRQRNTAELLSRLMLRVGGSDDFYVELIGRTPLDEPEFEKLRSHLTGSAEEERHAACILAMQDTPDHAIKLLTDPNAEIRQSAGNCAAYNKNADTVLARLKVLKTDFPLESIADLQSSLELKKTIADELEKLDPIYREWRVRLVDDQPWGLLPQSLRYWIREQVFQTRVAGRTHVHVSTAKEMSQSK